MSTTFPVSAVKKADKPLPYKASNAFDLIEFSLKVRPEAAGSNLNNLLPNTVEKSLESRGTTRRYSEGVGMHGFLRAATEAFNGHYPLVLSPDDVWLCI